MPYIEQREMTASAWTALNPVLLKGEVGWESGASPKAKKGDGATAWNALGYWLDGVAKAPLASPVFTGDPQAPTAAPGDNDTTLANTAFVQAALTAGLSPKAPLSSPTFTGDPKAPTASPGDNDTSIANTAFVQAAITALIAGSPGLLNTLKELADAIGDDPNFATTMTNALALKAPLTSPVFLGDPQVPTATPGDNDTSIANTAFVTAALAAGKAAMVLTNTAALTFGAIAAQAATLTTSATQTITVTGAAVGDAVLVGPPSGINTGLIWAAWVSATNTVSIRLFNHTAGSITPTAGSTWRATVIH